ncbi:EpsG family protein [Sporosarcina sp. CAU 1771]
MWLFYSIVIYMLLTSLIFVVIGRNKVASIVYLIANISLLAFLAMFRSVDIGNDTKTYVNLFYKISSGTELSVYSSRFEIGYLFLNKILGFISSNHQILLIVTSLYIFIILGRFIYKYSKIPWLSIFLFFALRYYDISLSGVRQMLAIATILLAYDFIVKKKPVKFILIMIVATSFHTAAYLFLLAYPISKLKLNKKLVLRTSVISIILFANLDRILNAVLIYFPRYYSYVYNDTGNDEGIKVATLLGLLVTITILFVCEILNKTLTLKKRLINKIEDVESLKNQQDQIQSIFLLLSCAIMVVALKVDILYRFENIFSIFAIIYLPNSIIKISDKYLRTITIMITASLFFIHIFAIQVLRPEWQNTYPFTFFWNK